MSAQVPSLLKPVASPPICVSSGENMSAAQTELLLCFKQNMAEADAAKTRDELAGKTRPEISARVPRLLRYP